jgi:hypothetical protein
MKTKARWTSGIAVVSLVVLGAMTAGLPVVHGQAAHVRWDIISVDFATGTLSAGGIASARANDCVPPGSTNCSKITLTGSGTFVAPAGGNGSTSATTGGGTWETFDNTGASTGSGTYAVTGLVRWQQAPGTPPLPNDNIGNLADSRAGLVVLRLSYDDGSRGVLVFSCHLVGTPNAVFEGITASKGFVDYWNREAPPAPPGNANRTNFHLLQ